MLRIFENVENVNIVIFSKSQTLKGLQINDYKLLITNPGNYSWSFLLSHLRARVEQT